nr:MAG TPA: hypothetical protein [Caudoviricetes sp.]
MRVINIYHLLYKYITNNISLLSMQHEMQHDCCTYR